MARTRAVETRERDARAVELRRRALTYPQISKELGFKSPAAAYYAVQRGVRDSYREDTEAATHLELERLDDVARQLYRVMATRHYAATASGKVAVHPVTGEPLADDGPVVQAAMGLVRVSESRRKLLGLDAPARSRVEVITSDMIEAQIRELEAQLAVNDPDHSGIS